MDENLGFWLNQTEEDCALISLYTGAKVFLQLSIDPDDGLILNYCLVEDGMKYPFSRLKNLDDKKLGTVVRPPTASEKGHSRRRDYFRVFINAQIMRRICGSHMEQDGTLWNSVEQVDYGLEAYELFINAYVAEFNTKRPIAINAISSILKSRWKACYMVSDGDVVKAYDAFENSDSERLRKVYADVRQNNENLFLNGAVNLSPVSITDYYNEMLAEEIEAHISKIMAEKNCDRAHAELLIAEALSELRC